MKIAKPIGRKVELYIPRLNVSISHVMKIGDNEIHDCKTLDLLSGAIGESVLHAAVICKRGHAYLLVYPLEEPECGADAFLYIAARE